MQLGNASHHSCACALLYFQVRVMCRFQTLANDNVVVRYLVFVLANKPIVGYELHLQQYYSMIKHHFELNSMYPIHSICNND